MCVCVCVVRKHSVVISNASSVCVISHVPHHCNTWSLLFLSATQVQAEIKNKWQKWKLGTTDLDDLRNTGSHTPKVDCVD